MVIVNDFGRNRNFIDIIKNIKTNTTNSHDTDVLNKLTNTRQRWHVTLPTGANDKQDKYDQHDCQHRHDNM